MVITSRIKLRLLKEVRSGRSAHLRKSDASATFTIDQMSKVAAKKDNAFKRRFVRYPVDVKMTVNVFRSGERFSLWGRSNEFGQDGIGGTLTGQLESGEVVAMELDFPMVVGPLKIRAVVRYRDGLRHGFEFLTRTPEQTEMIERICERLK